jgi:metal-responsive CopG/Arc/MetJ family transcriptional regulator
MTSEENKTISRITISVPSDLLGTIDKFVKDNFLTRNKWFLDAINLKMEKDRLKRIDEIVRK